MAIFLAIRALALANVMYIMIIYLIFSVSECRQMVGKWHYWRVKRKICTVVVYSLSCAEIVQENAQEKPHQNVVWNMKENVKMCAQSFIVVSWEVLQHSTCCTPEMLLNQHKLLFSKIFTQLYQSEPKNDKFFAIFHWKKKHNPVVEMFRNEIAYDSYFPMVCT